MPSESNEVELDPEFLKMHKQEEMLEKFRIKQQSHITAMQSIQAIRDITIALLFHDTDWSKEELTDFFGTIDSLYQKFRERTNESNAGKK